MEGQIQTIQAYHPFICHMASCQLMLNCWFGLVWDSRGTPKQQSLSEGDSRNTNHRAPNQQLTISWSWPGKKKTPTKTKPLPETQCCPSPSYSWLAANSWEPDFFNFLSESSGWIQNKGAMVSNGSVVTCKNRFFIGSNSGETDHQMNSVNIDGIIKRDANRNILPKKQKSVGRILLWRHLAIFF